MYYIKSVLLVFSALIIYCNAFCQVDKYNITGVSYVQKDRDNSYLYQQDWVDKNEVGVMNIPKKSFEIITNEGLLEYSITSMENSYKDPEGNLILKMNADDGKAKCTISFITLANPIDGFQEFIKIEYAYSILLYRYKDD